MSDGSSVTSLWKQLRAASLFALIFSFTLTTNHRPRVEIVAWKDGGALGPRVTKWSTAGPQMTRRHISCLVSSHRTLGVIFIAAEPSLSRLLQGLPHERAAVNTLQNFTSSLVKEREANRSLQTVSGSIFLRSSESADSRGWRIKES